MYFSFPGVVFFQPGKAGVIDCFGAKGVACKDEDRAGEQEHAPGRRYELREIYRDGFDEKTVQQENGPGMLSDGGDEGQFPTQIWYLETTT